MYTYICKKKHTHKLQNYSKDLEMLSKFLIKKGLTINKIELILKNAENRKELHSICLDLNAFIHENNL